MTSEAFLRLQKRAVLWVRGSISGYEDEDDKSAVEYAMDLTGEFA